MRAIATRAVRYEHFPCDMLLPSGDSTQPCREELGCLLLIAVRHGARLAILPPRGFHNEARPSKDGHLYHDRVYVVAERERVLRHFRDLIQPHAELAQRPGPESEGLNLLRSTHRDPR